MQPTLLMIGLQPFAESFIRSLKLPVQLVSQAANLEKLAESAMSPEPPIIVCGPTDDEEPKAAFINELAQVLRINHQHAALFFVTTTRRGFNRKDFQKNGFNEAFLLPPDNDTLADVLRTALTDVAPVKFYKPVSVVDIVPGTVLGFDVYLHMPMNNKHVRFAAADKPLDEARAKRLVDRNVNSVHVSLDQMKTFYKFTATQLRKLSNKNGSVTEMRERRETAIRNLMSGLFEPTSAEDAFAKGREILNDCKEIVKAFIADGPDAGAAWYQKLIANIGQGSSSYNHAANASTYAALFSIGTGIGNPEEMAMAGLLHDIGLADVPPEIVAMPDKDRTPEQRALYEQHCDFSVRMIKERKLILPEIVFKAIEQHHERFDGTGFPKRLPGEKICDEAQLISFVGHFDHATSPQDGRPTRTPRQVVEELYQSLVGNPGQQAFNPDIIRRILKLFPQPENKPLHEVAS